MTIASNVVHYLNAWFSRIIARDYYPNVQFLNWGMEKMEGWRDGGLEVENLTKSAWLASVLN